MKIELTSPGIGPMLYCGARIPMSAEAIRGISLFLPKNRLIHLISLARHSIGSTLESSCVVAALA